MDQLLFSSPSFNGSTLVVVSNEVIDIDKSILGIELKKDSNAHLCSRAVQNSIALKFNDLSAWKKINYSCKTHEDRVNFVKEFYQWIPMKPEVLKKYQKNSSVSRRLRDGGKEKYGKKDYGGALRWFTLAAMFAEPGSEDLGMAFANLSAALINLGDPEGALVNIQRAMDNNYPESLRFKLRERKLKCEQMIQEQATSKKKQNSPDHQIEMDLRKKILDEVSKLKNPNPLMPAAADFVEIKRSDKMGRMLVVNRDVQAGTVILVEDPFVSTVDREDMSKWIVNHCHQCLKRISSGIPCKSCVFAVYCDEACRSKANEGTHKYECQSRVYLHCNAIQTNMMLAFQIICKVGPQELYQLFLSKDPKYFSQDQPFGTEPHFEYHSDSYLSVFHLETKSDKILNWERFHNTFCALFLTSALGQQSKFFEEIPENDVEAFKNFIASLILRHIESTSLNVVSVEEGIPAPHDPCDTTTYSSGSAIYPTCSLLNHSCDPNVICVNTKTGGIVVMSIRSLKKGEQILICYKLPFALSPLQQRRDHLLQKYYFRCDCIACRNDFPMYIQLLDDLRSNRKKLQLTCSRCCRKFYQDEKDSPDFRKCILEGPFLCLRCGRKNEPRGPAWKCGGCANKYDEGELYRELNGNCRQVDKGLEFRRNGCPGKAVDLITKLFDYFQFHVGPPNAHEVTIQNDYFKAVLRIMHSLD